MIQIETKNNSDQIFSIFNSAVSCYVNYLSIYVIYLKQLDWPRLYTHTWLDYIDLTWIIWIWGELKLYKLNAPSQNIKKGTFTPHEMDQL